ncbi:hypothetical protein ACLB2K_025668 [Fragaria x ananassa]
MVLLSKPATECCSSYSRNLKLCKSSSSGIPVIDLSKPDSKQLIVKACEEYGFFKVINHGVPMDFINRLESEANKFFSLPDSEKEKAGPADPFGYGSKHIGRNGDVGWVEYLLLKANIEANSDRFKLVYGTNPDEFRSALNDYIQAVRTMACEILELMAEGLNIGPRNVFSNFLLDEQSDSLFRLNHYPPCPELQGLSEHSDRNVVGFGEHTDPQIISILRSNNTSGLQILGDGTWISVPPDQYSFFINVGDSLKVLTNGRFQSVRHRVLANGSKSRVSMIFFGGSPLTGKIAPLPSIMKEEEQSMYKEFTWFEYKTVCYHSRLADNRLGHFERIEAS